MTASEQAGQFAAFRVGGLPCGCTRFKVCAYASGILDTAEILPTPEARAKAYRAYISHRQEVNRSFAAALKILDGKRGQP